MASCAGLGRKSVACVLLLSLGRKEFPVDVNVARICARLGWVPLDSEEAIEVCPFCKSLTFMLQSPSLLHSAASAVSEAARPVASWPSHKWTGTSCNARRGAEVPLKCPLGNSRCHKGSSAHECVVCRRWTSTLLRRRCMSTCGPGEALHAIIYSIYSLAKGAKNTCLTQAMLASELGICDWMTHVLLLEWAYACVQVCDTLSC